MTKSFYSDFVLEAISLKRYFKFTPWRLNGTDIIKLFDCGLQFWIISYSVCQYSTLLPKSNICLETAHRIEYLQVDMQVSLALITIISLG